MHVYLYEDNAGSLYLVADGRVWFDVEQVIGSTTFEQDARAIERGDTADWTLPVRPIKLDGSDPDLEQTTLIAVYADSTVGTLCRATYSRRVLAGVNGRAYLGIAEEESI